MPTLIKTAWTVVDSLTPMFKVSIQMERGGGGPDEQELLSWLSLTLAHAHTTEDVGMWAQWLAGQLEGFWPDHEYEVTVRYRTLYSDKNQNGVSIRRRVQ